MSTPFRECPACGAHLDAGERCDCAEATAAAERARARTAKITPPERGHYEVIGVDLAHGPDFTATAYAPAKVQQKGKPPALDESAGGATTRREIAIPLLY